jgi:hypothetical protein
VARIERFSRGHPQRMTLHDPIDATYFAYELDGRRLLQINIPGRRSTEGQDKASRSIQLDEGSASQLFSILKSYFDLR